MLEVQDCDVGATVEPLHTGS